MQGNTNPQASPVEPTPAVCRLGRVDYEPTWRAMQQFSETRALDTRDELWIVEHFPVFTIGLNGTPDHLLRRTEIPVVHVDRGGQITYHGPGQLVIYLLLDVRRRNYGVRELVRRMERAVIALLGEEGIAAAGDESAPGVYVGDAKIASLGLRVKNGCCYHGVALNIDLDLAPFADINPCGHVGMPVTRTCDLGLDLTVDAAGDRLSRHLLDLLD